MPIRKTAYQTQVFDGAILTTLENALAKTSAYQNGLITYNGVQSEITGQNAAQALVPSFNHPYLYSDKITGMDYLVVDVRPYGRYDPNQDQFNVRNVSDYKLQLLRNLLENVWVNEAPEILRDISPLPLKIYAQWVTRAITTRFFLDPRQEADLSVYAAWFYLSQFTDVEKLNENDRRRFTVMISRQLGLQEREVAAMTEHLEPIQGLVMFAATIAEFTKSVRLGEMNAGILYSLIGSSWFGTNAKELVQVALEHPPTWVALLYKALADRTFKNSGIAKIMERQGLNLQKDFVHGMQNLITSRGKTELSLI